MFPMHMIPRMAREAFTPTQNAAKPPNQPETPASTKGQPDHHKARKHLWHAMQALNGKSSPEPPDPSGGYPK